MKYFEIKSNTKEYKAANRAFTWKDAWQNDEVLKEFQDAIGISPIKNMQMNPYVLRLLNIPDGIQEQFKKNRLSSGHYEAFAKSDINKKYLEVIKKHNLTTYSMTEFLLHFGWNNNIDGLHLITTKEGSRRFFLDLKESVDDIDVQKFKSNPCLEEIKEYDYLILRAEMLKSQEDSKI